MRAPLIAAAALLALSGTAASAQTAPAPAATAADPARLEAARRVVDKLVPVGTYKKMMADNFGPMMDSIMDSAGDMPLAEVIRMSGISAEDAAELGEGTIRDVMDIYDPHWNERMKLTTDAVAGAMGEWMVKVEPGVREALTRAYAREFSLEELNELARFFSTPAGGHYAAQSMAIFMDPEMMKAMTDMMPEMMKDMPALMEKVEAAAKDLPEPRKNSDLTPAERKKLAQLLGVDPATLEKDPAESEDVS
jgi:hypothetical protein